MFNIFCKYKKGRHVKITRSNYLESKDAFDGTFEKLIEKMIGEVAIITKGGNIGVKVEFLETNKLLRFEHRETIKKWGMDSDWVEENMLNNRGKIELDFLYNELRLLSEKEIDKYYLMKYRDA